MTCRELAEFLDAYLAGDLAPAEREEFERHLAVCGACVNYLYSYRATVRLAQQAFADESAPDDVPEDVVRAILAARKRK